MDQFENFGMGNMGDPSGPVGHEEMPPDPDQMSENPQQVYGTPVYPDQQMTPQQPQQGQSPVPAGRAAPLVMGAIGAAAGFALAAMIFRK